MNSNKKETLLVHAYVTIQNLESIVSTTVKQFTVEGYDLKGLLYRNSWALRIPQVATVVAAYFNQFNSRTLANWVVDLSNKAVQISVSPVYEISPKNVTN